jgi:hypothetical protein
MSRATTADSAQLLGAVFSGQVLGPGDPGYDEARRIHNGLIDKRPALIARCQHTADVVDAVNFGGRRGSRSRSVAAVTTLPARRSRTGG